MRMRSHTVSAVPMQRAGWARIYYMAPPQMLHFPGESVKLARCVPFVTQCISTHIHYRYSYCKSMRRPYHTLLQCKIYSGIHALPLATSRLLPIFSILHRSFIPTISAFHLPFSNLSFYQSLSYLEAQQLLMVTLCIPPDVDNDANLINFEARWTIGRTIPGYIACLRVYHFGIYVYIRNTSRSFNIWQTTRLLLSQLLYTGGLRFTGSTTSAMFVQSRLRIASGS